MKICINAGHYPGLDSGAVGTFLPEAMRFCSYRKMSFMISRAQAMTSEPIYSYRFIVMRPQICQPEMPKLSPSVPALTVTVSAYCIQNQIVNSLGTLDRGVKDSQGLYVLKHTDCPAILVETAFISNESDEHLLADRQADFAHAIARGITDYYA